MFRTDFFKLVSLTVLGIALQTPAHAESVSPLDNVTVTTQTLVDTLKGPGVTIAPNPAVVDESDNQIGIFNDYGFLLGADMSQGVILSTGNIADVVGANSADNTKTLFNTTAVTDSLIGSGTQNLYDRVKLSFTVTPAENTLIVEYVFGSEEYNEFVNGGFNDFIRIFVDNVNCAVTANGLIVSIDAVNNGSNSFLYKDNDFGDFSPNFPYNTEMDGFTKTVSCRAQVTPGAPVAVDIIMADDGDASFDSWAFFKAHSLRSEPSDEYGDAPDSYQTLAVSNGAAHTIIEGVYMGTTPSGDQDGFVDGVDDSAGAAGDDASDDGVLTFPTLDADLSTSYSITVNATSINGKASTIRGWIDFDGDGQFQADEASNAVTVAAGSYESNVTLSWPTIGAGGPDIVMGASYARIRMVNGAEVLTTGDFAGSKASGEVEDYILQITGAGDVTPSVVTIDAPPVVTTSIVNAYPVSGNCTAGDENVTVSISGATPASQSVLCNGGGRWTASFDVSGIADGTNVIIVDASQQDSRGNLGNATTAFADKDVTPPSVSIQNAPAFITNNNPYTVTFQFSEDVTGFALVDISVTNATAGNFVTVDANTYTADITPDGSGNNVSIDVAANVAQDLNANNNTAATQAVSIFDSTAPAVTITSAPVVNAANETAYTVSGGCTSGDGNVTVAITGATPGSQAVACSGGAWSAVFDVSAIGDAVNVLAISASQTDAAGNIGSDSTTADKESDVPTVAILNAPAIVNSLAAFNVTFEFSENVTGFDVTDIALVNASAGNFVAVDGNTYTADITPDGTGNISIDVAANAAQDGAANGNTAAGQVVVLFDNVAPVVSINPVATANIANSSAYAVSGSCTTGDSNVTVAIAGATPASQAVACSAGSWNAVFDVSAIADGANVISINASQSDTAGNTGAAAPVQADKDTAAPAVSINRPLDATAASAAAYTVDGSCTATDGNVSVSIAGATPASQNVACGAGGNWNATFDVTAIADGVNAIVINASQTDAAGNTGAAATEQANKDTVAPVVSINSAPTVNAANAAAYTVSGNCTSGDNNVAVSISSAAPASQNVACDGAGNWSASFDVSAIADGLNAISIDATQSDAVGNTGSAATTQVDKDTVAPTIDIQGEPVAVNSTAAFNVSFVFSETVTGFDVTDIVAANATVSNFVAVSGSNYTADITPDGNGDITIDVAANAAQDTAGNASSAAAQVVTLYDTVAPTVDIQGEPANVNGVNPFNVTIQFSEAVTGFAIGDITLANATASNFAAVNGSAYTVDITPDGAGDVTIDVAANVAQDIAGNNNTAAPQAVAPLDATPPDVAIQGAPAAANLTPFFVTIQFSEAVSGFDITDIVVSNAAASNFTVVDAATYTVDLTANGNGDITIDVPAGAASDGSGNASNAAATVTVLFDNSAPVVTINPPVAANIANQAAWPVSGSCATNDGAVNVRINVAGNTTQLSQSPGCNAGVYSASFDVSIYADGAGVLLISASQTDVAGNTGSASDAADKDTIAPAMPTVNPQIANTATPTLSGGATLAAGEALTVTVNGVSYSDGDGNLSSNAGSWSLTIPPGDALADNTYEVQATVTDAAGNSSSDASNNELTVDTTAPSTPTVNNLLTNNTTPTLTGVAAAVAGETLTVSVNGVTYTDGDGNLSLTAGIWTLVIPAGNAITPDGVYEVTATLTDAAGNSSADVTSNELEVDTTAPVIPTVNAQTTNNPTPVIDGTAEAGSSVTVVVAGATYSTTATAGASWSIDTATATPDSGSFAPNVNGANTVFVTSTDAAGNAASDVTVDELVIDTTPPATPTVDALNANSATPTLAGTATVNTGESLAISVNGVSYSVGDGNLSLSGNVWTLAIPAGNALADATYEVTATVTDTAGNSSSDASSNELLVDTQAPSAPTVNPLVTNNTAPTLDGTATVAAGETLTVSVNGVTYTDGDGNLSLTGNNWTLVIPAGNAITPDGDYEVTATVTDLAGNSSTDSSNNELTIDTSIQVPTVGSQITNNPTPVITGTAEAGSSMVIVVAGATYSTTTDNSGNWSVDTSAAPDSGSIALAQGANDVDATSTDAAGNSATDVTSGELFFNQDDDNDGIPNNVECPAGPPFDNSCPDTDGDGAPDYLDTDSDNDGISDSNEAGGNPSNPLDTDGDGIPDFQDTDSDNDGAPDSTEGVTDSDGDGIPDYVDQPTGNDFDGDGIPDNVECPAYPACPDTDGDGIPDYADTDADNDGISDAAEAGTDPVNPVDTDGDGTPDFQDTDSDNDGAPDSTEGATDADGDGIPDYIDAASGGPGAGDSDGDGIADNIECAMYPLCADSDNDGTPDYMETDSDNDGIPDAVETGTTGNDTDGDGIDDALDVDSTGGLDLNGDGIDDTRPLDTDGDGTPDYQDTDSDNDGIPDATEGAGDSDGDGIPDYLDVDNSAPGDSDGDGVSDAVECPAYPTNCPDTDGDGVPDYMDANDNDGPLGDIDNDGAANYMDPDDDGDGIPDSAEDPNLDGDNNPATGALDTDGDGIPDYQDTDSDGDGIPDAAEGSGDSDGDGIPDYLDVDSAGPGPGDSDGDGIADNIECPAWPACPDSDGDGRPDYMDSDSDNDGIPDAIEYGGLTSGNPVDTDGDGAPDYQDPDSDNQGGDDASEAGADPTNPVDSDGDGIPDYADPESSGLPNGGDSDGDGVEDAGECISYPACADADGDNIPDYNDADSRPYDPNAVIKTGLRGIGGNGPLLLFAMLAVMLLARRSRKPALLMLLLGALSAQASDIFQRAWYLGAGLGASDLTPATGNTGYGLQDGSDSGYKLFTGVDIDARFSVEAQQAFLGAAQLNNQGNPLLNPNAKIDYELPGASLLWYVWHEVEDEAYSYRHGWQAFVMAGLSSIQNSANVPYSQDNNFQIHFGGGVEYGWDNGIAVRLGADAYDEDATFLYVAALYRFGYDRSGHSGKAVAASDAVAPAEPAVTAAVLETPAPVVVSYETVVTDVDGDGVADSADQCPNSAANAPVDATGCALFSLSLEGVNFETNSADITKDSEAILNKAAEALLANPQIRVEVQAHTDDRGRKAYNQKLSEKRAASVRDYLIAQGVDASRMTAKGYGESQPVADNSTAAGRAKNRRVELKIIQ